MPLTVEQKRKLKTEKKEQKLREAAELRIKTKKDELAKEVSTSQGVLANKMKLWYTHNYAARFPLLKDEMEIAWHSYEHTLDVKDFIIWQLQARIDEARIQEAMSWQDYVIKVDTMIDDYHTRVDNLDKHYQDLVKRRMEDAMAEFKEREISQTNLEDYYKTVLYIMDEQSSDVSAAVQGEYLTKRDEEAKRGLHLTEFMSTSLEKMIQDIATAIKDCIQEYKDTTESRKREVDLLRTKDSYYLDVITRQDVRVAKLCDEMINLQSQVTEGYESRLMLEDLKSDREETYSEYKHVRANLNRASSLDATQLLTLTTHSNNSIKHLERVLEKGEKIVRLGVLCINLETQEEKDVPFGMSYVKFKDLTGTDEPFVLFWRRFASVNLRKRKLESTLKKLQDENKWLKMQLKTAIDMLQIQFTCLKIEK